jgi:hydroxymethylglutaryl-CoA reductase (NADPH)
MVQVPPFLLRRLYVKGSLRNTEEGFEFQLKNSLGAGYAQGLLPLTVDGQELPREDCYFSLGDAPVSFSAVDEATPFTLAMNKVTTIVVRGRRLEEGQHRIGMGFVVVGLGKMAFEVTDHVGEA